MIRAASYADRHAALVMEVSARARAARMAAAEVEHRAGLRDAALARNAARRAERRAADRAHALRMLYAEQRHLIEAAAWGDTPDLITSRRAALLAEADARQPWQVTA